MADRLVTIRLKNCGEKTCASEPGVFCNHMLTRRFGTEWVCGLFRRDGEPVVLDDDIGDGTGWLMRCRECLEAER